MRRSPNRLWILALALALCVGCSDSSKSNSGNQDSQSSSDTNPALDKQQIDAADTSDDADIASTEDSTSTADSADVAGEGGDTTDSDDGDSEEDSTDQQQDVYTGPDINSNDPPQLDACEGQTFSKKVAKVSYMALDKRETGIIPADDTASGTKTYRNPLATIEIVKPFLDQVNNALTNALKGYIEHQQMSSGPMVVALELGTDGPTIDTTTPPFHLSVFGAYVQGFVQGFDPTCGFLEDNITKENICTYDFDLISFATPDGQCLPRFRIEAAGVKKNAKNQDYLYGTQSLVHLILPIGSGDPVILDIFDVEIDATILNEKNGVPGVFLGHGTDVPNGVMAGVVCADQLSVLINSVQNVIPGQTIDWEPLLEGIAKQVSQDPQFKVDPDPCAAIGRDSRGLPIVLRFRTIPALPGNVIERDLEN